MVYDMYSHESKLKKRDIFYLFFKFKYWLYLYLIH